MHVNTFGVLSEPYFAHKLPLFWSHLKLSFYYALTMTAVVMIRRTFWLIRRGKQQARKNFIRGGRLSYARRKRPLHRKTPSLTINGNAR